MLQETSKIWMDGKFVDWKDATVHVLTHTLHYGLGVFEGIRCYKTVDGRPSSGWPSMSTGFLPRRTSAA